MPHSQRTQTTDPYVVPLPGEATDYPRGAYDPFPTFQIHRGQIQKGYAVLARKIREDIPRGLRVLVIDGYHGVAWDSVRRGLVEALASCGISPSWVDMQEYLRPQEEIQEHVRPFLGGNDALFGTRYPFGPEAFFDAGRVATLRVRVALARGEQAGSLLIIAGCGAGLLGLWDQLWYLDIPKDVLQAEARRLKIAPLGFRDRLSFGEFYKQAYFVDWPALNQLKSRLLPDIDCFIDAQTPGEPASISGDDFRTALRDIAETPFRVRPWFFPGPWGGAIHERTHGPRSGTAELRLVVRAHRAGKRDRAGARRAYP